MKTYSKNLQVTKEHLDFNDHVNNLVYLQWAVDLSREHWYSVTDESITSKFFWMVRRHTIEYKKQAFEGDEIKLETYVENIRGPFSERIVKIYKEEEIIVEVRSNWCMIERATQKLKRVPQEIVELFI